MLISDGELVSQSLAGSQSQCHNPTGRGPQHLLVSFAFLHWGWLSSWLSVFLIRRIVRRALGLHVQHSWITLLISSKIWGEKNRTTRKHHTLTLSDEKKLFREPKLEWISMKFGCCIMKNCKMQQMWWAARAIKGS